MPNIVIEEIVNNITLNIDEVVSTYTIEVSEMQVPGADGKSAYQSAIDGGFIGTELEFNQSLAEILPHIENVSNPHNVTKSQIGLSNVDNTSDINKPISIATQTGLNLKEDSINKGASLGYAPLDINSKVPLENINDALLGNVHYQGLWNATTNTPNLDIVESKGHYYICTNTAEATRYGILFNTGDWIISDGINWGKVDNTDAVSTVFGRVGNVTAQSGDYNTGQVTEAMNKNYQTDNQKLFNDATSSIQTQLDSKALDNAVVHLAGDETITGKKTLTPTLTATANNQVLVGLDINPTFNNAGFTGVSNISQRLSGDVIPSVSNTYTLGNLTMPWSILYSRVMRDLTSLSYRCDNQGWFNNANTQVGKLFANTGNWIFQNGGTFTDLPSARLQVNSTTQGFLPPRMTNAQRIAISSPAIGLCVYCTDTTEGLYIYKSTGWAILL